MQARSGIVEHEKNIEKLVKKAMKGNPQAYGQLIEEFKEYLYRTAYLYTKEEQAALDAVGDCILNGFRSIKSLKEPKHFKTWLTRILYNAAKDSYKKNWRMVPSEEIAAVAEDGGISQEEKMDLYSAIDGLTENYKTVIILKYFNQLKINEIAYAMDMPEGTVKAYLNRAKGELRNFLKEDYLYAE